MDRTNRCLLGAGAAWLCWAVAGNYLALPGYLRFLERGSSSTAGNTFDADVVVGAAKTISWMLAWNLGAICFYLAAVRHRHSRSFRGAVAIAAAWMVFWSWPALPRPGAAFFLAFGSLIVISILVIGWRGAQAELHGVEGNGFYLTTALLFFGMATWDVCGLGATGRILHPEQVVLERSQMLLQTQSVKLMLAFAIAWLFMALAAWSSRAAAGRTLPARSTSHGV